MLGHIVQQWKALVVQQITVVVAREGEDLRGELDHLAFPHENRIHNPAPERGMFSSIQCAASWSGWSEALTHWVLVLGDQPHLQLTTFEQLLDFVRQNPDRVCQPLCRSQWRHPVVLPKPVFERLSSSKEQTLREFLEGCDRAGFACDDPGLDHDIDTPEDYQKALEMAGATKRANDLST